MKVTDSLYVPDRMLKVQQEFCRMGCAQLRDAAPEYTHVLDLPLTQRTPGKRLAGQVFPVETENDMLPCLQALDAAPQGAILFIQDISGKSEALAGDIYVTAASQQGLGGLIVNGAARDVDFLPELNFSVFSRSINYVSAKMAKTPSMNIPCSVQLGDLLLEPGDWIFGDGDGLLVIKQQYFSAVFTGALMLCGREEALKAALREGRRMSELCGLEDFLAGRAELKFEG